MIKLTDERISIIAIVGKNGEGKSYSLNMTLSQLPNKSIYISEDGIANILYQKNRVSINNEEKLYIYMDEKSRGDRTTAEQQIIGVPALTIIKFCNNISTNLKSIVNKSLGQKKLQNIIEIFLSYNLNNIEFILFDEPENFLDEQYLKLIAELINLLEHNGYKVRIATHNSRLLSLINININDILILSNRNEYQISIEEVKDIFKKASSLIQAEKIQKKYDEDASIRYKLGIAENSMVFSNYIESNLKNIEFYRSLFYKELIIVEGISDLEALNSIKNSFDNSVFVYACNGKAWIPFYAMLFTKLNKEVTVIIDGDPSRNNHATAITTVLENMETIKVVKHNPDMETFYGINIKAIGNMLGMSNAIQNRNRGWLKQIAAYYHFKIEGNNEVLINHVFNSNIEDYKFE